MEICQKERSNKSCYDFRQIAREVTRELYDIPDGNIALFAYSKSKCVQHIAQSGRHPTFQGAGHLGSCHSGWPATRHWSNGRRKPGGNSYCEAPCGVLSMSLACSSTFEPSSTFDSHFYHHITFLFVKPGHQQMGVGRQLVNKALRKMAEHDPSRPVRVESALGAAEFFEKLGFVRVGEPYGTAFPGSRLFQKIVNMEHVSYHMYPNSYPT